MAWSGFSPALRPEGFIIYEHEPLQKVRQTHLAWEWGLIESSFQMKEGAMKQFFVNAQRSIQTDRTRYSIRYISFSRDARVR